MNSEKIKTVLKISRILNILFIAIATVILATGNPIPWWLIVAIILI